jgi:hypothetical protein
MANNQTPFRLSVYAVSILQQLAVKFPEFFIDGVCFDMGVGMTMSCRGVSPQCLTVYLRSPDDEELSESTAFSTYLDEHNQERAFPAGLRIWVLNDVLQQLEYDEDYSYFDLVFLNPNYDPPLFFAEMKR